MSENDNVVSPFRIVADNSDQTRTADEDRNEFVYQIVDIDGTEYVREGFCIFTSSHVAIMTEIREGVAIPVLVLPLQRVALVDLVLDETELVAAE